MHLLLLLAAAATPVLGPQKSFGDWAVACDNVLRCEMTSLLPENVGVDQDSDWQGAMVSVIRDPASAGTLLEVYLQGPHTGRVDVRIDGKVAGGGTPQGDTLSLGGVVGATSVAAMVAGRTMTIADAGGKTIARVSLSGSSAALRFIDAEQGLAGTIAAAVAKGPKPDLSRPRPLPVITFPRPPSGDAPKLSPELRKTMMTLSKCDDEFSGATSEASSFRLDTKATLVLLPCGSGAYNTNEAPFVVVAGTPRRATFDAPTGWSEDGPPMLINADFDPKTGRLVSYGKGRGVGDCGSSEAFVWDGATFRLVEATRMGDCRGSVNWLTVWRAEARPR